MVSKIIGFLVLQIISTLIFLIGYFSSVQQLSKQSSATNPFFERDDWFFPQFDRLIFFIGDVESDIQYNLDIPIYLEGADLFNILMRGINPISQLQYGLAANAKTDSLPHQIAKNGSSVVVSSLNNYDDDYIDALKYISFDQNDYAGQFSAYVQGAQFKFLYVDSYPTSLNITQLAQSIQANASDSVLFMVLQKTKMPSFFDRGSLSASLRLLTTKEWLGREFVTKIQPIESVASSLALLLNIPLPLENHGLVLPGLIFNNDYNVSQELIQFYDNLMNLEQLAAHLYLQDKNNHLFKSQEQKRYELMSAFSYQEDQLNVTKVHELIQETRHESSKINKWLNEQISGNVTLLFLGVFFGLVSIIIFLRNKTTNLYGDAISLRMVDRSIILICLINVGREYQLPLTSVLVIIVIGFMMKQLTISKKANILFRLGICLIFFNFPNSLIGFILSFYFIGFSTWMILITIWGLWRKVQNFDRIYFIVGGNCFIFSMLQIPYLQEFLYLLNLIGALLVLQGYLLKFLKYRNRLLIFLALNSSYMINFIPIPLILGIIYFAFLLDQIERLDINSVERENDLFHKPTKLLLNLVIYQVSLSQLPNSPKMLQSAPILVQVFLVLIFVVLEDFVEQVQREKKGSIAVRYSYSQWVLWIEEALISDEQSNSFYFTDQVIGFCLMVLSSWLSIFLNELFMWDTSPHNLGQEYFYLQDSLAYLFILLAFVIVANWDDKEIPKNQIQIPQQDQQSQEHNYEIEL